MFYLNCLNVEIDVWLRYLNEQFYDLFVTVKIRTIQMDHSKIKGDQILISIQNNHFNGEKYNGQLE